MNISDRPSLTIQEKLPEIEVYRQYHYLETFECVLFLNGWSVMAHSNLFFHVFAKIEMLTDSFPSKENMD